MNKVIIEIQYFDGCPNAGEMLENARKAFTLLGDLAEYKETLVETLEKAKETGFRGSPTLLVNGIDIENLPANPFPALSCRFYQNGIPSAEMIAQKVLIEAKNNQILS